MKIKVDTLDRHFSFLVRERDGWKCQRCGKQYKRGAQGLHCSHYFGRRKWGVRFSYINTNSSCYGCHSYWHTDHESYRAFKIRELGLQGFRLLELAANRIEKRDPIMVRFWLREEFRQRGLNWDLRKNGT